MRYEKAIIDGKAIAHTNDIERELKSHDLSWLITCEFDNANIEVIKNTLIWNGGVFYYGKWQFGIFKKGEFRGGDWYGGVFYGDTFSKHATWHNGVKKSGNFYGKWLGGVGR